MFPPKRIKPYVHQPTTFWSHYETTPPSWGVVQLYSATRTSNFARLKVELRLYSRSIISGRSNVRPFFLPDSQRSSRVYRKSVLMSRAAVCRSGGANKRTELQSGFSVPTSLGTGIMQAGQLLLVITIMPPALRSIKCREAATEDILAPTSAQRSDRAANRVRHQLPQEPNPAWLLKLRPSCTLFSEGNRSIISPLRT